MQENVQSKQEERSTLLLKIEEKKLAYKKARRPILWYWILIGVVLIIAVLAGIGAYYFWLFPLGILSFLIGIGCIFLIVSFFATTDGFDGLDRITNLLSLGEGIRDLQTQLRLLDEFQAHQRSPRQRYKDDLFQTIFQYKREANSYRRTHYTLQIFIIFFSLVVTGLTSGLTGLVGIGGIPWITPVVSFSVSFLTAMTTLFRFHDRGFNLQQTADAIEYEINCADLRIFDYSDLSDEDALHKLSERGARLTDEQRKRQLQLEQSSNTKHTPE